MSEALALNLEKINKVTYKFRFIGKGNKQRWRFYGEDLASVLKNI